MPRPKTTEQPVPFSVRLPARLVNALRAKADADMRSVSATLQLILREALKDIPEDPPRANAGAESPEGSEPLGVVHRAR